MTERFDLRLDTLLCFHFSPAQRPVSVSFGCPPFTESLFARKQRYLQRHGVSHHVRESYLPFIAPTGSCASPKPSSCLGVTLVHKVLCRLLRAPAGRWPFPALSLQSLRRCLDPYPAASLQCICSLLPEGQRPHLRRQRFGTPGYPYNATSTGLLFSGLQSFLYVQAPTLARPPGCTHR